jgi:hypothetical protein
MRRLQLESEILRRFAPQNDSFCDVFKEDILSATRRMNSTCNLIFLDAGTQPQHAARAIGGYGNALQKSDKGDKQHGW